MVRLLLLLIVMAPWALCVQSQKVVIPVRHVQLPPGYWADTLFITYDTSKPLGTVRTPNTERYVHLVLKDHPGTVLKGLLRPELTNDDSVDLQFLRINRLRVDEVGPNSLCLLHAEVLLRSNGKFVRVFERPVTITGKRSRGTSVHEENITKALDEFLRGYARAAIDGSLTATPVDRSALQTPLLIDETLAPIIRQGAPSRGLYHSYLQMRMNEPDTSLNFELRETVGSMDDSRVVKLRKTPDAAVDRYWGLSDGEHAYMRFGSSFIQLERAGAGFTLSIPQPDTYDPSSIVLGGMFFGMIGAGIAAAATTSNPGHILCDLDLYCGEAVPRSTKESTYAAHIFQVSRYSKSDDPVHISVEGMGPISLAKEEWTMLELPPQAAPVSILITGPNATKTQEVDTNTDRTNFYLIEVKKDGSLQVSKLNEYMRSSAIDDLKPEFRRTN